jgi:hypothetical protein
MDCYREIAVISLLFVVDHWEAYAELISPELLIQMNTETHDIERTGSRIKTARPYPIHHPGRWQQLSRSCIPKGMAIFTGRPSP